MGEKLSLIVQFAAMDQLSGALKGFIGLGKSGEQSLKGLKKEAGELKGQMNKVTKELGTATGNVTKLVERERELARAIEGVNARMRTRANLNGIEARRDAMVARGAALRASGQSGLMWASMATAPIYAMARAGGEVEGLTARLRVLGLGDGAVRDLRAYADAMIVAGSSTRDNLRYIVEAQGAFRESGEHSMAEQLAGAKMMAPMMAKLMTTSKALGHELSEDQERYFLRFIEQAGGMNSPARAAQLADGLFRAIQSSGGNVDPANYQTFLARAGTAGMKLSARAMFADFEPLIAELHESAGVGLQSAYSRANGMVKNSAAGAEMIRLGLWDKSKVELNSLGGIKAFKRGQNPLGADMANLMATSPIDFYIALRKKYDAGGVKDVQRENMMLFGRTGGMLFNLIDKQLPTILRSRGAYEKTQGLETAYKNTTNSFFGQQGQMRAAWQDFMVVAGSKGGLLDNLVAGMRGATAALRAFTAFGNAHPTAFKWIGTVVTGMIGIKVAGSALKLMFGGLLGPAVQLWSAWAKYKELGSLAKVFRTLASVMGVARVAVLALGRGVLQAGLWMMANPMVALAVGIGAAVVAIYIYRKQIVSAITSLWTWVSAKFATLPGWMRSIGSMIMQGLLMAINPVLLVNRLTDVAKLGITAFKNYFGIKSPSRLMMQMGRHIATGLGMGVDGHAHRPLRAITRMGAAMSAGLAVASPGAAVAGRGATHIDKVEIHIHQQPGENADALARRVADAIRRMGGGGPAGFDDPF